MANSDERSTRGISQSASPEMGVDALNIRAVVTGLIHDLEQLRSGEISIPMARARAALGHQILRGVSLVIAGQKFIEGNAKILPSEKKPKGKRSNIVDAEINEK